MRVQHSRIPGLGVMSIAVIIPCLNEERTIGRVVRDFKTQLPNADVYVIDNNSTDKTMLEAVAAGAIVLAERRRGKGYAVKSAFQRIQADIYVMVDGDDTYPAEAVHRLIEPIADGTAEMVVGSRLADSESQFRRMNLLGNRIFLYLINAVFGAQLTDVLSGFRAMSHGFVKGLPLFKTGFEVEVEITIKALERGYRLLEIPIALGSRPEGSYSKIRRIHDGSRIMWTICTLLRDYKPLTAFGTTGLILVIAGLIPGIVAVDEFLRTGLVLHFPSAILAVGMILTGTLCGTVGIILHTINRRFQELDSLLRAVIANSRFESRLR